MTSRYQAPPRDVQASIKRYLIDLGLKAGDAIPTEARLTDVLGVSRGSLREALKALEALGIIRTKHGSGMQVGQLSLGGIADQVAFHSTLEGRDDLGMLLDLLEIREAFELQLIRRVAVAADQDQLDRLNGLVSDYEASTSADMDEIDRRFHRELYSQLGNALLLELLDVFWSSQAAVHPQLGEPMDAVDERISKHRAIVDAVVRHDPDAAHSAMQDHFAKTRAWFESGRA